MSASYRIRMLTLHHPGVGDDVKGTVEAELSRLLEARDRASSEYGLVVETVRLTLPNPASPSEAIERVKSLEDLASGDEVIISIGNLLSSMPRLGEVIVEASRAGLFTAVLMEDESWETARKLSGIIHRLTEEDPSLATRTGVNVLGEPLLTPYYPLSYSPGGSRLLTTALTYPNYLRDEYMKSGEEGLKAAVERAAKSALEVLGFAASLVDAEPGGVDLSVAPWMEESSLGLAELVAGVRLPQPGFGLGVMKVNMALAKASARVNAVGFNEVQLPVAEDLKLKARVSEGDTSAATLARLTGVCLAGLDLAVVPASVDGVAGLILEVAAYSRAKGKPLGVRIVPVEGVEPGDKVYLDKFGETPVIAIYP